MNFLFGGAETNPITQYNFKLADLVRFHGLSPSWQVLYNFSEKLGERISRINSYEDLIENRMFHGLQELKDRMPSTYSRFTMEEAIKVYKDKQYAKETYGLPSSVSSDTFSDLNKMKNFDLRQTYEQFEDMMNILSEVDSAWGGEGLPDELAEKGMTVLYGQKWLDEIDKKISDKMNDFTLKLFDLDIWDFDETIKAFIEAGELDLYPSSSSRESSQARSRSGSRSRSSSRSSRARSQARSRSGSRSRSSSQGSRRSRSRSRSRPRSRSSSQGSRRSRSRSRSRPRSRSASRGSRRSRSRSRSRPRSRSAARGSRHSRSRSRASSRSRSSQGVSDLERRFAQLQQTPPQENSNSSERRRRINRENESFENLERRYMELQDRPVSRRLFD